MSLRSRLLLSYILVVVICLVVIGLSLIGLLRDNPIQRRTTFERLTFASALVARFAQTAIENGAAPENLLNRLGRRALTGVERVMIADAHSGTVVADSAREMIGHSLFDAGTHEPSGRAVRGELPTADGGTWLYVGWPIGPEDQPGELLAVVAAREQAASLLRNPLLGEMRDQLFIAGLIALVVSVALALIVARSIAKPIQHVAQAAGAIAAGDLRQTAPVEGPNEVQELASNFNTMADRVRASQQSQRDFLANVSHELKTPLTSIRGFAQAIVDGAAGEAESIRKSASIIHDESERMARMVGELLDLSRIETGQMAMRRLPVPVGEVLRSCVEKQSLRAGGANISLTLDAPADLPAIQGDGDRLAQVFGNLIDNALKHAPAGGKVIVSARAMTGSSVARRGKPWPGAVEVSVTDTGPGIPPEDLARIFERFYQIDKSRARAGSSGSLGLGLAIAKEIVAAHGGSIHAESVTGLGTKFVVRLPIDQNLPSIKA